MDDLLAELDAVVERNHDPYLGVEDGELFVHAYTGEVDTVRAIIESHDVEVIRDEPSHFCGERGGHYFKVRQ